LEILKEQGVATPLARLTEIVRSELQDSDIVLSSATRFEDLTEWDSMHLIAVVVEVECCFHLLFEPDEIETLHTAGDLLRLTARKQALASI
jgi:acyl carrier protein